MCLATGSLHPGPGTYSPGQAVVAPTGQDPWSDYTEDLAHSGGKEEDRLMNIAVKRVVFNVTSGKEFMEEGSPSALTSQDSNREVSKIPWILPVSPVTLQVSWPRS